MKRPALWRRPLPEYLQGLALSFDIVDKQIVLVA